MQEASPSIPDAVDHASAAPPEDPTHEDREKRPGGEDGRSEPPQAKRHRATAEDSGDEDDGSADSDESGPRESVRVYGGGGSGGDGNGARGTSVEMMDAEEINLDEDGEIDDNMLQRILAAARARGIPLEFLAHMQDDGDDEDIEYPFERPPESLKDVADFIGSDKCKKIVVLAGAGMSVASGIPDFRSSNGLYATLDADKLTADEDQRHQIRMDPSFCLDQHLFLQNPLPCLEVNREFILGVRERKWKATLAHRFVEMLYTETNGKLRRLYTQNIDGLEDQCTGLSHTQRIAVHGSMDEAACAVCRAPMDFDAFCDQVRVRIKDIHGLDPVAPANSAPIMCPSCGAPAVKPNIVLFRSSLPREFFENAGPDTDGADLLIVIGTSLGVAPANSVVWRVPRSAMRVLVNREPVGWHLGLDFEEHDRDFFGRGNCENVVLELMKHLGWLEKLRPLLDNAELPESSCELLREELARLDAKDDDRKSHSDQKNEEEEKKDCQQEKPAATDAGTPKETKIEVSKNAERGDPVVA